MDYQKHYQRLCERARSRQLIGYAEYHHVIPRCMGGSDEENNIVKLTPEEHFLAHELLVKIHPTNTKLIYACLLMRNKARQTNKSYGWVRRRLMGKPRSIETRRKIALGHIGNKLSEETKAKISKANKGKLSNRLGTTHKPETLLKMSTMLKDLTKTKPRVKGRFVSL